MYYEVRPLKKYQDEKIYNILKFYLTIQNELRIVQSFSITWLRAVVFARI